MSYQHTTDINWLLERKKYITATDILALLPSSKKWDETKPLKRMLKVNVSLMTDKLYGGITDDQVHSYGAMARGHLLEPYAVQEFNTRGAFHYHWDDKLIYNSAGLSFSPDALDAKPWKDDTVSRNWSLLNPMPRSMLEIKCYSPGHHMQCVCEADTELTERYQIAVAMAVCDLIEVGNLVFYCPSLTNGHALHIKAYTRIGLEKEIEEVHKAVRYYFAIQELWYDSLKGLGFSFNVRKTEEEIKQDLEQKGQFIV